MAQLKKLTFKELKFEFEKLMRSIENFVPIRSEERVKRPGSRKEVPAVAKEEEIERLVKKRGKRQKTKARKGLNVDKNAPEETDIEEERDAHIKDKVKDPSSGIDIPVSAVSVAIKPPSIANWKIIKLDKKVRVHCLTLESAHIYMLTERRYPIPADVCQAMLDKKIQGGKKDEVYYQLLKLIEKQAQNKLP
ncbi:hypothetical protein Tco_1404830 [Tanacetum coccineum]